jgi:hypothetical protein
LTILLGDAVAFIDQQPHGVFAILGLKELVDVVSPLQEEKVSFVSKFSGSLATHNLSRSFLVKPKSDDNSP